MLEQEDGPAGPAHGGRVVRRTAGRQAVVGRERIHRRHAYDPRHESSRFRVHNAPKLRRFHVENVPARQVRASAAQTYPLHRGLYTGTVQTVPAEQLVRVPAPTARRDRRRADGGQTTQTVDRHVQPRLVRLVVRRLVGQRSVRFVGTAVAEVRVQRSRPQVQARQTGQVETGRGTKHGRRRRRRRAFDRGRGPRPSERAVRWRAAVPAENGQRPEVPGPDAAGPGRRGGGGSGVQSAARQTAGELGQPVWPDKDDVRTGRGCCCGVRGQAEEERGENVERHLQVSVDRQHRVQVEKRDLVQARVVGRERFLARHQVRVQTGGSEIPRAVGALAAIVETGSSETGPLAALQQFGDHGAPAVYLPVAGKIRGLEQQQQQQPATVEHVAVTVQRVRLYQPVGEPFAGFRRAPAAHCNQSGHG